MEALRHKKLSGGGYRPSLQRIYSFDYLKAVCAFLVVCIHCPFSEPIGEYVKTVTRCAVPLFFMTSGFFYSSGDNGRWKKQTKRIAFIMLGTNILYLVWSLSLSIYGGYFSTFAGDLLSWKKWLIFVALNDSMFSFHLWYLGAILCVTLIFRAFKKIGKVKFLLYISPVLIVGSILLGKYSKLILGVDIPLEYSRNWIFVGLPYYTIGAVFFDRTLKIAWNRNAVTAFLIAIVSLIGILERFLLVSNGQNAAGDIFITTPVLAILVFLFTYNHYDIRQTRISEIGKKYTTSIYVLHIVVDKLLLFGVGFIGIKSMYNHVRPIMTYLITLLLIVALKKITQMRSLNLTKARWSVE